MVSVSSTWHSINRIVTHSCSFIQTLIIVQFRIIHKALFMRLSYWMETELICYSASSAMAAWRRKSEKYRRNDIQHSHVWLLHFKSELNTVILNKYLVNN